MRKMFMILITACLLSTAVTAMAGEKYDFNCFRTPRSYGNWQNGQQFADTERARQYKNWADQSGNRNDRGWQELYDRSNDFNRRYNTFFGPNNNYDD